MYQQDFHTQKMGKRRENNGTMYCFNQQTSDSRNDYDTGIQPQDVSMNAISQKISMNVIRT